MLSNHRPSKSAPRKPARRAAARQRRLGLERLESRELMAADMLRPLAGDFDGNGSETPGLYSQTTHQFFLRNANTPGFPQIAFEHAALTHGAPIAGDWHRRGVESVGLFDAALNTFYLAGENSAAAGVTVVTIDNAPTGGTAVVGDWLGNGYDTVGVYHAATFTFYLKINLLSGPADYVVSFWPAIDAANVPPGYGDPAAWTPLSGDFTGAGKDTLALLERGSSRLYVQQEVGQHLYRQYQLAAPPNAAAEVLTGDWDNSGDDSIGFWNPADTIFSERSWLTSPDDDIELYVPPTATTEPLSAVQSPVAARRNPVPAAALLGSGEIANGDSPAPLLPQAAPPIIALADADANFITQDEVNGLLRRAAAASSSQDGIIAIVDRGGRVLGVRVEQGVFNQYVALYGLATPLYFEKLTFAIDGAIAKARTAASFASGDQRLTDQLAAAGQPFTNAGGAPLTSRTIRNLSQSTVTEREVDSDPNFRSPAFANPFDSPIYGPGFVAPIGLGGHFPPDINFTPPVDLFHIEHQGRDSLQHPGLDGFKGSPTDIYSNLGSDDIPLPGRFNVDPALGPLSQYSPPEAYGKITGLLPNGQGRGFATLPGGIPLYKNLSQNDRAGGFGDTLVGGIGVFFPGALGYATFEQGFVPASMLPPNRAQTTLQRVNAPRVLEAEWIAYAAAGGSLTAAQFYGVPALSVGALSGVPRVAGYDLPFGRIDLVGITLEIYGPHPTQQNPNPGVIQLLQKSTQVGTGSPDTGANTPVSTNHAITTATGQPLPFGWLVLPQNSPSGDLTVADVERIVNQGVAQARVTRAAIRLPLGTRTAMVLSVADKEGNVLGVFRMQDATVFSIDVSVAKARNTAYYADPTALQPEDFVDDDLLRPDLLAAVAPILNPNGLGNPDIYADINSTIPFNTSQGLAFTNRTFRFLAEPRFPSGQDGTIPPVFSILTDPGINITNGDILRPDGMNVINIPASAFTSVAGFDAFHAGRNFHDPSNIANQNGVVFFPGSTPLYKSGILVGGFGVSGDGVDQDDVVTAAGMVGYDPPLPIRADRVFYRGVRLPFQKFNRNPEG